MSSRFALVKQARTNGSAWLTYPYPVESIRWLIHKTCSNTLTCGNTLNLLEQGSYTKPGIYSWPTHNPDTQTIEFLFKGYQVCTISINLIF